MVILRLLAITTLLSISVLAQTGGDSTAGATLTDVLILGAGMAGTAAARTLHVNGITDYIVLEATDQIGGRVKFNQDWGIEVGANWIQGLDPNDPERHPLWREWLPCDADGPVGSETPDVSSAYDSLGNPFDIDDDNGIYRTTEARFYEAVDKAGELAPTADICDSVRDGLTDSNWIPVSALDNSTEWYGLDACIIPPPEKLSLYHSLPQASFIDFLNDSDSEAIDYLIYDPKGFKFVVECLARDFKDTDRLKFNAPVTRVVTSANHVCATLKDNTRYCAPYAVVTFPAGVLQASIRGDDGAVEFEPELPPAINNITMANFTKIFLRFEEQFWNNTGKQQLLWSYSSETRGYYPIYYTIEDLPNVLLLVVTEELAEKVTFQDNATTINEIMTIVRLTHGQSIPDPIDIFLSPWIVDPLSLGAYEAVGPCLERDFYDKLLEPINNRLYLAGSGLNRSHSGFVHGAYGSGVQAANQILDRMIGGIQEVPPIEMSLTSSERSVQVGLSLTGVRKVLVVLRDAEKGRHTRRSSGESVIFTDLPLGIASVRARGRSVGARGGNPVEDRVTTEWMRIEVVE